MRVNLYKLQQNNQYNSEIGSVNNMISNHFK